MLDSPPERPILLELEASGPGMHIPPMTLAATLRAEGRPPAPRLSTGRYTAVSQLIWLPDANAGAASARALSTAIAMTVRRRRMMDPPSRTTCQG